MTMFIIFYGVDLILEHDLGYFTAFEDAKNAYLIAAQQLHGEFATKRGKDNK